MRKLIALSVAACVLVPSVAFADPGSDVRVSRVSYADINIMSPAGQKVLDRRIAYAALNVCSDPDSAPMAQANVRRCRKQALVNARLQVNQVIADARGRQSGNGLVVASR